jgi:hypothetical protein
MTPTLSWLRSLLNPGAVHQRGTCQQPYVTMDKIEAQVDALYGKIRIQPEWRERVRAALREDAEVDLRRGQQEVTRQQQRLDHLAVQKQNLAPSLREAPRLANEINNQLDEIEAQERAAKRLLADATVDRTVLAKVYEQAEKLIDKLWLVPYMRSAHERRVLNQFFFDKILVRGDEVVGVVYTEDARLIPRRLARSGRARVGWTRRR